MRRIKLLGAAALLTLVASGVAVAHEGTKTSKTDPAAATFAAERTKVSDKTCTGSDGHTYRVAHEEFRGTVTSSDPRLAGTLVLKTRSVIDQTNGLGQTFGHASLRSTDGKNKGKASLVAVNTQRGILDGVLTGFVRSSDDEHKGGNLVANFRAVFAANGLSFTGELGGGASQNTAVIQRFAGCPKEERSDKSGKAKIVIKKGEISSLTSSALTVKVGDATVTFTVNDRLAKIVDELDLAVGTKVEVAYVVKGDTTTLLKLRKA
jgi:hypothetical protein